MHGSGTRLDITTDNLPARLLDLTRLIRRAGRVMTGIDRVEFAYLRALSSLETPCWGLARTRVGYVLIPPDALPGLVARFDGTMPWPTPKGLSRFERKSEPVQRAALTYIRTHAEVRLLPSALRRQLARMLPKGTQYFNVGHSNLTPRVMDAVRGLTGQIAVMLHDMIPVDFPQYQRPGTPEAFLHKLRLVQQFAEVVICNSTDTAIRAKNVLSEWGPAPRMIVSHLGTDILPPSPGALPSGLPPNVPYFVMLGTIEPRKNHAMILDLWEAMGDSAPHLVICGTRGWSNETVLARLDALPKSGCITEVSGLSDGAVAALLEGASGLLFPSFAEGYGLPAIEAAARGVPVIASELPSFREVLGNIPIYAAPTDSYQWKSAILSLAENKATQKIFNPPSWESHFKTVLNML